MFSISATTLNRVGIDPILAAEPPVLKEVYRTPSELIGYGNARAINHGTRRCLARPLGVGNLFELAPWHGHDEHAGNLDTLLGSSHESPAVPQYTARVFESSRIGSGHGDSARQD